MRVTFITTQAEVSLQFKTRTRRLTSMRSTPISSRSEPARMTTIRLPARDNFSPFTGSAVPDQHAEALGMRVPRLVWASGESFEHMRLSVGSELLRFGLKEWAGIREIQTVRGVATHGGLSKSGVGELLAAIQPRAENADLPIVVCRDVHVPARIVEQASSEGRVSLVYLGAPEDPEMRLQRWPFRPAIPPIPMPSGMTPDLLLWMGMSAGYESQRGLDGRDAETAHLHWMTKHLSRAAPLGLWLVINLDRLRLGRAGPGYLDDSVVAALMRWTQGLFIDCGIVLLSESRVSPACLSQVGNAAQVIGRAMYRRQRSS